MSSIVSATIHDTAVIANGGTKSTPISAGEFSGGTFQVPAEMTGTTLTWEGSLDGTNFETVKDSEDTALDALTFTEGQIYHIPAACFQYAYIRLGSNGTEAAERSISVFLKG